MTERELKKLSRADLLEMLIDQSAELQRVQKSLSQAEDELSKRQIAIDEAGSIAEAALQLNGVFEAAQASCEQYMENIRALSSRQEEICKRRDEENQKQAAAMLAETERLCANMEYETKKICSRMIGEAQTESAAYWNAVYKKLEEICAKHPEIREILDSFPKK